MLCASLLYVLVCYCDIFCDIYLLKCLRQKYCNDCHLQMIIIIDFYLQMIIIIDFVLSPKNIVKILCLVKNIVLCLYPLTTYNKTVKSRPPLLHVLPILDQFQWMGSGRVAVVGKRVDHLTIGYLSTFHIVQKRMLKWERTLKPKNCWTKSASRQTYVISPERKFFLLQHVFPVFLKEWKSFLNGFPREVK